MIIAALNESPNDSRVAIAPTAVKHYLKLGLEVLCESEAGRGAGFSDAQFEAAGAHRVASREEVLSKAKILVAMQTPAASVIAQLNKDSLLICPLNLEANKEIISLACEYSISLFSMNAIPRISRAQSMDSLSSQANLAGYRAVLEGVYHYQRVIPMMMTAAGMIQPAKILVLGAGVAGLQAIATAKRLGAVVYAFDVRAAAKEQVESLGAEFIVVADTENHETASGYARETSETYKAQQAELIHKYALLADIVISSALIPGKIAPRLLSMETVKQMKPGSVIVDMATSQGGNCELSQRDSICKEGEVSIIGYTNLAGLVPATASELYSGNLVNLLRLLVTNPDTLTFNPDDEIIQQALICHAGRHLPFQKIPETES